MVARITGALVAGGFLAASSFGAPVVASAQPTPAPVTQPLTLPDAVRYALAHDPTVLNDRATLAQAEEQFVQDHAAEFPTLAGELQNQMQKTNGYAGGALLQYGIQPENVFSLNTAEINSTWTFYNGTAQLAAQQAKRTVESDLDTLERAQEQLAQDVATAWYTAVQRRDAVQLAIGDLAYQKALLATAQAEEKVGRVAGVDVLRAEANELHSAANLVQAQADDANARDALAQRIGAPPDTPFALPAVLPEPPLPTTPLATLVSLAEAGRPDIGAAKAQVAVAKLADAQVDNDLRPQFSLGGSFGNQTSPTAFGYAEQNALQSALIDRELGLPAPPTTIVRGVPGFWTIQAQETFTLPLMDYGTRHAKHRAARAQIAAAQAQLSSTEGAVAQGVRQALRGAQAAQANLAYSKEADQLGAEAARIAQLQYRNGLISLTDVLSAQQTALTNANDLIAARVAYLEALIALRAAIGIVDPVALVQVGAP
jgi:outer membrane protein TolC